MPGPVFAACPVALAPGMRQLNSNPRALRMNEPDNLLELRNVLIFPDAKIVNRDPPLRNNRGSLKYHQPRTALSTAPKMNHMPVMGKAILGRILAHRRNTDSIGKSNRTKLK